MAGASLLGTHKERPYWKRDSFEISLNCVSPICIDLLVSRNEDMGICGMEQLHDRVDVRSRAMPGRWKAKVP